MAGAQRFVSGSHDRVLHRPPQLLDIVRPEVRNRRGDERQAWKLRRSTELAHEMAYERKEILSPLAHRWHADTIASIRAQRSARSAPRRTILSRSRCVAEMSLTCEAFVVSQPRSLAWTSRERSPISSSRR